MALMLEILTGSRTGDTLPMPPGKPIYVGRNVTAHLVIEDDDRIAETHFSLQEEGAVCRLRDMGTRTGTYVNGAKVHEKQVRAGDKIQAGQTTFLLRTAVLPSPQVGAAPAVVNAPASVAAAPSAQPRPAASTVAAPVAAATAAPATSFFPSHSVKLLEQHWEELEFLWRQREGRLRSPTQHIYDLAPLEDRIEAHVQGLLAAGVGAVPVLEAALGDDDAAGAAAYALLQLTREGPVLAAFTAAEGARLVSLTRALCLSARPTNASLVPLLGGAGVPALAALEVLAFRQAPEVKSGLAERFLAHADAPVRRAAWRVVALGAPCGPERFAAGWSDPDVEVRRRALEAAAWHRSRDLMPHCRSLADRPESGHLAALYLLAVLGGAEELQRIQSVGKAETLGPGRFGILGAFGHPGVVDLILDGMQSADPRTALAAGAAFRKITGVDVNPKRRVTLPPEDGSTPDDFEKEFLDEAFLADPARARERWGHLQPKFAKATRWGDGRDLSRATTPDDLARLDLESGWEGHLRLRFAGAWNGTPAHLERFLQSS